MCAVFLFFIRQIQLGAASDKSGFGFQTSPCAKGPPLTHLFSYDILLGDWWLLGATPKFTWTRALFFAALAMTRTTYT